MTEKKSYKIVVLGLGGVGKTAITMRYVLNEFPESYTPTVHDSFKKTLVIDNENVDVEILDSAGQIEDSMVREGLIQHGDGFVVVYSIKSWLSFQHAEEIIQSIQKVKESTNIPIVLMGNKCDLKTRKVQKTWAEELANPKKIGFFESSAKVDINIEESFNYLLTKLMSSTDSNTGGCCNLM
eukprot:TRINITY_DN1895_c0_g1_i1.p1 TRINITY_DN1895_c0_g1~~TRINITY_DN1895_c0_g1_i1.p1  ORF type:complete len:191 (+),score=67.52 TRINITY_DN1895_c0_g1_i1:29-574(+)